MQKFAIASDAADAGLTRDKSPCQVLHLYILSLARFIATRLMASDPPSDTLAMCPRHPAEPLLGLACPECRGSAELCPVCLNDHAAAHPGHAIMAAASLRARIREAMSARLDGCSAHDGGAPLIACARHKAAAISAELEALSANEAAVLEDLRSHRHLLGAAFETRLAEVHNAAATKRVALQTEAVAADAALERACSTIDVVARVCAVLYMTSLFVPKNKRPSLIRNLLAGRRDAGRRWAGRADTCASGAPRCRPRGRGRRPCVSCDQRLPGPRTPRWGGWSTRGGSRPARARSTCACTPLSHAALPTRVRDRRGAASRRG